MGPFTCNRNSLDPHARLLFEQNLESGPFFTILIRTTFPNYCTAFDCRESISPDPVQGYDLQKHTTTKRSVVIEIRNIKLFAWCGQSNQTLGISLLPRPRPQPRYTFLLLLRRYAFISPTLDEDISPSILQSFSHHLGHDHSTYPFNCCSAPVLL